MSNFDELVKILVGVVPDENWDKVEKLITKSREERVLPKNLTRLTTLDYDLIGLGIAVRGEEPMFCIRRGKDWRYLSKNKKWVASRTSSCEWKYKEGIDCFMKLCNSKEE